MLLQIVPFQSLCKLGLEFFFNSSIGFNIPNYFFFFQRKKQYTYVLSKTKNKITLESFWKTKQFISFLFK